MNERNSAFFGLYENAFITLKDSLGEEKALELFRKIMEGGLKTAYDSSGFVRGDPNELERVIRERDESVGLHVKFPVVGAKKIVYQFHDDPFPGLKGIVEPEKLDDTYMHFKASYLLGEDWSYKTTTHIWKGDECTEHVITKNE